MSDFEPLDRPSETESGRTPESWYVEVIGKYRRCLLNACFVEDIAKVANPLEELYYATAADAYACMEEYYIRHCVPFPYKDEMTLVENDAGYSPAEPDTQQVMEFI